jgi:dihydrofolate reductase
MGKPAGNNWKVSIMRQVMAYLAMSLDGYIADQAGGVDWLDTGNSGQEENPGYPAFLKEIDTVVMGRATYDQIVTHLSPREWPYAGMTSYVFTHRPLPDQKEIWFVCGPPESLLHRLRACPGKGIWLCGGSDLICQWLEKDLIDQYVLTFIPVLLGGGIRLFPETNHRFPLTLLSSQTNKACWNAGTAAGNRSFFSAHFIQIV